VPNASDEPVSSRIPWPGGEVHLLRAARPGSVGADGEVSDGGVASGDRARVSALPPATASVGPGRSPAACDRGALVRRPSCWAILAWLMRRIFAGEGHLNPFLVSEFPSGGENAVKRLALSGSTRYARSGESKHMTAFEREETGGAHRTTASSPNFSYEETPPSGPVFLRANTPLTGG
jgi:hypothetical protein